MPTRIIISIAINHQVTGYVYKNPHLYNLHLSPYNGDKITTNTNVSDAVELDIDVSCQCYTYLLLCFWFKVLHTEKRARTQNKEI